MPTNTNIREKIAQFATECGIGLCDGNHPRMGCERERAFELVYKSLTLISEEIEKMKKGLNVTKGLQPYRVEKELMEIGNVAGYNQALSDILSLLNKQESEGK